MSYHIELADTKSIRETVAKFIDFVLSIGFCRFAVIKRLFLFFCALILPFTHHFGQTHLMKQRFATVSTYNLSGQSYDIFIDKLMFF